MWKMINYEARGRSHYKQNLPCQDKTITREENGVYCIALSDGAGSAKLSHYGAETVVNSIADYVIENFEQIINTENAALVKQNIVKDIVNNLERDSKEHQCKLKDLSATLLFLAIKDDKFIIGHIGDGIIGYLKNNKVLVASEPNNGEFINSTVFVTSSSAISNMKLFKGRIKDISGFVLMSDGTADSFYNKRKKNLSQAIKRIIKWNAALEEYKIRALVEDSFENIVVKNTTDDCSIAIISRIKDNKRLDLFEDDEKLELLGINSPSKIRMKKNLKRCEQIIHLCDNNKSLNQISKQIHLKPKYTKRKIKELKSIGLIKNR